MPIGQTGHNTAPTTQNITTNIITINMNTWYQTLSHQPTTTKLYIKLDFIFGIK